jgi:pyridoxine/pyridoxamine 5'-phosphate oxidase
VPDRGRVVVPAGSQASAADFLARPPDSRAEALIGRQSEPLDDPADLDRTFRQAQARPGPAGVPGGRRPRQAGPQYMASARPATGHRSRGVTPLGKTPG